ncbi:MAG: hypothetical protein AB7H93_23425 [Vicinamibacterales bacterium]
MNVHAANDTESPDDLDDPDVWMCGQCHRIFRDDGIVDWTAHALLPRDGVGQPGDTIVACSASCRQTLAARGSIAWTPPPGVAEPVPDGG